MPLADSVSLGLMKKEDCLETIFVEEEGRELGWRSGVATGWLLLR